MKTISRYIMTLALLLTAVTGAWAQSTLNVVEIAVPADWENDQSNVTAGDLPGFKNSTLDEVNAWTGAPTEGFAVLFYAFDGEGNAYYVSFDNGAPLSAHSPFEKNLIFGYSKSNVKIYYTAEAGPKVAWDASTKTGTFSMPGSDVVLTPRYAAATLYENDGETEKQAYETLKEAFANVQDGDVIKLDWDVTLTEDLATPTTQGGVKFTIDFNGYTLDAGTYLYLANAGDQLTFTDTSGKDKLGGLKCIGTNAVENAKYIFDSGRYKFGKYSTAESMNALYETTDAYEFADGKEFVDIANGPDADDFNLTVGYKSFELTIGAGRFDTFYANQNVALDAETPAGVGLYTITLIEEDSETGEPTVAYLDQLTGVVEKETPMLVYNGTDAQQTVKIKVTPDEADAENEDILPLENFMGTAVAKTFTEDDMTAADYYALSGGKLFVPVYDAGTIGKNQCWLQFNHANGAPARGITLVFEKETTGVNEVLGKPSDQGRASEVNEAGDGAWYDLSGRKLNAAPIKGVYIKDGKKIVK